MSEPPGYHKPAFVYGRLCLDCEFYNIVTEKCEVYDVPVAYDHTCLSWKRDPRKPFELV